MSKEVEFKNRDRFIQLGIAIAALRKMRGMSQEKLAELSNVSRSHISAIEAPGIVRPFSLEVFYNIADALDIDPADLINASVFPDKIITNPKHYVLSAAHPSPLSAMRGFMGCRHFSKVNTILQSMGKTPIDWQIENI